GASPGSRRLIVEAAEQGFWRAHRALGEIAREEGRLDEARLQFRKALEAGDGYSAYLLATMARPAQSEGSAPNAEACRWAERGANLMNYASYLLHAECLEAGGDENNKVAANGLLWLVASQDDDPTARAAARWRLDRMAMSSQ